MNDLIIKQYKAHIKYILTSTYKGKDREQFIEVGSYLLNKLSEDGEDIELLYKVLTSDNLEALKHKGSKLAVDILKEIIYNNRERFIEGRSGEGYLERIL